MNISSDRPLGKLKFQGSRNIPRKDIAAAFIKDCFNMWHSHNHQGQISVSSEICINSKSYFHQLSSIF